MSEEYRLLEQSRKNELRIMEANARESLRRTQEALRKGMLSERRQWFSYQQGLPTRAYSEEELQRMFPEPEGTIGPSFNQAPRAEYIDDTRPNNFGAVSLEPDAQRKLWFELLSRTAPPADRASSQMAEVSSLNMRIRERRR